MLRPIILLIGFVTSCGAFADWMLDSAASSFEFETTKNKSKSEEHHFRNLSGTVKSSGRARVEIDLRSVDTKIPIRDQRMKDILFATMGTAIYEVDIDPSILEKVARGKEVETTLEGKLTLNGFSVSLPIEVEIKRKDSGEIKVESESHPKIDVDAFGYGEGIEKLREIAGLRSISHKVELEFELIFSPQLTL